jgi:hypothetical protein
MNDCTDKKAIESKSTDKSAELILARIDAGIDEKSDGNGVRPLASGKTQTSIAASF